MIPSVAMARTRLSLPPLGIGDMRGKAKGGPRSANFLNFRAGRR